jgi:mannose-1-phosphate guanylyltransferase
MRFCCRSRCIQMDIRTQKTNMNKQKMTSETTLHGGVKKDPTGRMKRWGLVLAGGDGVRLRRLTRLISGDDRPKQFCSLFGGATLLGHARQRAERSIPGHQVLYSLTHEHEQFYVADLADCPSQRVVQPSNKGTAPGIVSGLLHIARADEQATVAILPSDHYFSNEDLFTENLEYAFEIAVQEPRSIIVLGAQPNDPETEYGWIEPGETVRNRDSGLFRVNKFYEKPSLEIARSLLGGNSLWNTFVMVGSAQAFLDVVRSTVPELLHAFRSVSLFAPDRDEARIPDFLYERILSTDFSRQVLSAALERLLVFQLGPVGWSDLGDPGRALVALSRSGTEPDWASEWRKRIPRSSEVAASAVA